MWSIWHLLVHNFGRYAIGAWFTLLVFITIGFVLLSRQGNDLQQTQNNLKSVTAQNRQLIIEGKQRDKKLAKLIAAQQRSRIRSCRKNYESFHEVFKPFLPKKGSPQYAAQRQQLDLFNKTIKDLKRGCLHQTKPKPVRVRDFPH